jgi:hypothetical protein
MSIDFPYVPNIAQLLSVLRTTKEPDGCMKYVDARKKGGRKKITEMLLRQLEKRREKEARDYYLFLILIKLFRA